MTPTVVQLLHAPWLWPLLRWALVLLAIGLALAPGRVGAQVPTGWLGLSSPAMARGDAGSLLAGVTSAPASPPTDPPPGAPPTVPGPGSDCALRLAGLMNV